MVTAKRRDEAVLLSCRSAATTWALAALFLCACQAMQPNANKLLLRRRPTALRNDAVWSIGCLKESWYTQRLDHFRWQRGGDDAVFRQRYFICDKFWSQRPGGERGPVFFYAGNEADVELYVNATGLIWEHAAEFGALVLFVEHRYYGKTQPFGPDSWASEPSFLSVEQALADYAGLLWHLTGELGAENSPIIAFGGSYGGMLAAWMRLKYPHLVAGAVAASAPVGAFPGVPGWEPSRFWEVVTYDATASAGAAPECSSNARAAFGHVLSLGRTASGRSTLARLLRLCEPLADERAALDAAYWLQAAFDAFAMGNYPYPSTYISGDPDHPLPAWPMRAACTHLAGNGLRPSNLVEALRDAAGVLYNATGRMRCYDTQTTGPGSANQGAWDYQWCTELMAQELPYYPTNGKRDMFWDQGPFDWDAINAHCEEAWGVTPRPDWGPITYGGYDYRSTSNIVFSNGLYDPWSAYGVLTNISNSVVAVIIPEGAHHVDLMYSNPADPPSLRAARQTEMRHVRRWIDEFYDANGSGARRQGGRGVASSGRARAGGVLGGERESLGSAAAVSRRLFAR
ncbi:hypothetical protein PLESTB_001077500 [Pleodorina starrii]|uniref:Lysosomal Pro-X carboxypeptidase n=1 Tax=Pleodorina starrii TaxID=330485 RepID=A0A9W6BQ64_9CHLO|nr:hypothetical protein PLESTM_001181600 [Pleodorina starrii]GLC56184.1 hypothetical protein PLESTB_001077500 [Pleodorina starrii]GLC74930.1 hypothetical protein PLESTF_001574200 [Pleodorina starrii]